MKKQILAMMALAAVSAFATATETELGGAAVSVIPITTSQAVTAVAVPFLEMDESGEVCVAHLVKTANLSAGDLLYVYQDGLYECWELVNNAWTKQNKVFTMDNTGNLTEKTGTDPKQVTREVGTGFLLKRTSASPAVTFYVYGKPSDKTSMTLTANAKTLVGNWTMTSKAPTIGDPNDPTKNPKTGDAIVIPNDGFGTRCTFNNGKWYHLNSKHEPVEGLPEIPAGTGFWYLTTAGSTPTISW